MKDDHKAFEAGHPLMVALDIDGTLHTANDDDPRAHKTISVAVKEAVQAVIRSGAHVVLCTGRLAPSTRPFSHELGIDTGFAVCSNGAVLINAESGRVVEQIEFELREPVGVLHDRLPGAIFVSENPGIGVRATGRINDADTHHGRVEMVGIDELAATSTTRLAVHWPGHSARSLADLLTEANLAGVRHLCYDDEPLADLTAAGVSKAVMLEKLRIQLGIPVTETLAVGDGVNDLEMLTWAAHGVAMGHAPAHVQAAADQICPCVTDDGLATALSQWIW